MEVGMMICDCYFSRRFKKVKKGWKQGGRGVNNGLYFYREVGYNKGKGNVNCVGVDDLSKDEIEVGGR